MSLLPFSTFSTASFSEKDRFDAWRDSIGVIFDVRKLSKKASSPFHAELRGNLIGEMFVVGVDSDSAQYVRSRDQINRDGIDIIMIQFFLEGHVLFRTGNDSARARTGDLIVFDLARPLDNINSKFRHISLLVPRDRMEAYVPGIAAYHGRPLPHDLPGVKILREHLLTLYNSAGDIPHTLSEPLSEATFSLVSAAFRHAPGISSRTAPHASDAVRTCLIPQIRRHIRENLPRQDLSPASIAKHFGMSKAQLYRVMEPVGGVSSLIRQQRLRACRRELFNPASQHLLIGEIAYKYGFSNIASFNRQFRQEFGCAPGDARGLVPHASADPLKVGMAGAHYQDWIRIMNAVGG